jgi:hypothetical protein
VSLDDLIAQVGPERYRAACARAWERPPEREPAPADPADADEARRQIEAMPREEWDRLPSLAQALYLERAGGLGGEAVAEQWPEELADVPHDLGDLIWYEGEYDDEQRVALALEAYRAMPAYAHLAFVKWSYRDLGRGGRALLWAGYRELLATADDQLAAPVAYSLWVDFYEDRSTVKEAWRETSQVDGDSERRLKRVLEASGPVPFKLKQRLYEQLAADTAWHPWILRSLIRSTTDVYGDLHRRKARRWLDRLTVPDDADAVQALRNALES